MSFQQEPLPITRRRRRPVTSPVETNDQFLNEPFLFSSLVLGPGIMASLSAASAFQHALPGMQLHGFPLAGLMGLLCGWALAVPGARFAARRLDPMRPVYVLLVAVVSGLIWATPAAFYAPAIGWLGGAVRLYIVAGVLSASGLIWGGYVNNDALLRE